MKSIAMAACRVPRARRATIIREKTRGLQAIADVLSEVSTRLHQLNAEVEALVWAEHPDASDEARQALRPLRSDAAALVDEAVKVLRELEIRPEFRLSGKQYVER